jgi:hypothetical protein
MGASIDQDRFRRKVVRGGLLHVVDMANALVEELVLPKSG